jgi:rRNA-processing protein FCF1
MTDQVQDQDVELEEENVEEAHDPKNAEAQSVASVQSAEDKGPTAKARKGDKKNSDKMAKVEKPKGEKVSMESVEIDADFSDDLNALVDDEATLSEEFKEKTAVIFEAAVKSKVAAEINRLEEAYAVELEEEVSTVKAELVEKVDSYLNYVVENWMEDNKLAIQSGLRAEIAEGFMNGLKDLFVENYIEVPESKVDLVDDLADQVENLEEKLNKTTAQAMQVSEELESYKREAVIREAAKDLAETQVEKLRTLAGDVDFVNEDTFAKKVATIKESYFSKTPTGIVTEEVEEVEGDSIVETSDAMARYVSAIKQASK